MKMRWPAVILAVFHLWCLSGGVYSPPDGRQVSCRTLPGESCEVPAWKENAEYLVLHFFAEEAGMLELNLNSGGGMFHEKFPYSPGEQFKILPLRNFRRTGTPSWEKLKAIGIIPAEGKKILMIGSFFTVDQRIPFPGLLLVSRVNEITPVGTAYPLYGIVSSDVYPKQLLREKDALQRHLNTLTGIALPQKENAEHSFNMILLGKEAALKQNALSEKELEKQGFNGFTIAVKCSNLVIAGESIQGTAYGVYRFLETQGMKFFAPGVHSAVGKTNILNAVHAADRPFFNGKRAPGRWCVYGDESGFALADPRNAGIDAVFPGDRTQWIDHTSAFLVPKKYYYDEHPEFYCLRADGTRMPKDTQDVRVMLCQSNPDGIRAAAERALRWIRKNPQHLLYVIQQGDDSERCVCEGCEAKRKLGWNETDLFLNWVNGIAERVGREFPRKYLLSYAYISTQPAPEHLKPAANVHLLYAPWPNRLSAPNGFRDFDAPENIVAGSQLADWLEVSDPEQLGIYDYPAGNSLTHRGMAHRLKWLARRNMRGSIWYCGTNRIFASMFTYVQARLCWNPLLDTRALESEFIEGYYGNAAETVKKIVASVYDRLDSDPLNNGRVPSEAFFTESFVKTLIADFAAARKLSPERVRRELLHDEYGILENGLHACSKNPASAAGAAIWKRYLEIATANPHTDWRKICDSLWTLAKIRCEVEKNGKMPSLIAEMIRNPQQAIREHRQTVFVEKRPNGVRISPYAFEGGMAPVFYHWKCPGRLAVAVRGTMTEQYRMKAVFPLELLAPSELVFEGQSCDKLFVPPVPIRITINGKTVFEGGNGCRKHGWTLRRIRIPEGVLRPGDNTLVFENLAKSDSRVSHWFMIAGAEIRRVEE